MKRSAHALPHPGRTDQRLPTLVCIDSPAAVAPRLRMLIGLSVGGALELTTQLVGCWLSAVFRQQFLESRTEAAGEFAIDAFRDSVHGKLPADGALIAAIGMTKNRNRRCSIAGCRRESVVEPFEFMSRLRPVQLRCHGSAHAYLNPDSGRAQVWLEQLPGSIELIAAGASGRSTADIRRHRQRRVALSRAGRPVRGRDAIAWYGLGIASGNPADIFESVKWQLRERAADRRLHLPVARNVQD